MTGPLVFYTGPNGSSDHRAVRLFTGLDHGDPHPMASLWEVLETIDATPDAFGVVLPTFTPHPQPLSGWRGENALFEAH